MKTRAKGNWRVVLLAVGAGAGALLCFAVAGAVASYTWLEPYLGALAPTESRSGTPPGIFTLVGGLIVVAAVLTATLVASLRTLAGRAATDFIPNAPRWWLIGIWILTWLGASGLVQLLGGRDSASWLIPGLHLLAIAAPIFAFARIAIGGISGGSKLRLWATLAISMLFGTSLAAIVEIGLVLIGAVAAAGYLIANPVQLMALRDLAEALSRVGAPEESMTLLGPILQSPIVLVLALAAVAVATPIVEELAKSIPVWAARRLIAPAPQGFWVGSLAGAGFALFEGILVSADAGAGAGFLLVLRAGSSLMHILASGLAGWGIGAFRGSGKLSRLFGGYLAAIGVHALWNAVVIAIGYGGIRLAYVATQPDLFGVSLIAAGVAILVALIGLLPIALIGLNHRLRKQTTGGMQGEAGGAEPKAREAHDDAEVA